jgi:hypothetical protein
MLGDGLFCDRHKMPLTRHFVVYYCSTGCTRQGPLFKQQSAQTAQIVQDSAACIHMRREFIELEDDQMEGFFAAFWNVGPDEGDFVFDFGKRKGYSVSQESHIFVGALDVVEGSFGVMAHFSDLLNFCNAARGVRIHIPAGIPILTFRSALYSNRLRLCGRLFRVAAVLYDPTTLQVTDNHGLALALRTNGPRTATLVFCSIMR